MGLTDIFWLFVFSFCNPFWQKLLQMQRFRILRPGETAGNLWQRGGRQRFACHSWTFTLWASRSANPADLPSFHEPK